MRGIGLATTPAPKRRRLPMSEASSKPSTKIADVMTEEVIVFR